MNSMVNSLELLKERFNGKLLIPFAAGSEAVGFTAKTARNKLSLGTFPIRTVLEGTRRYIHITDLASYVDSKYADLTSPLSKRQGGL